MAIITLQSIVKSFGAAPVLTGLNAQFERGDHVGLVGANGAGKSTMLRIIAGRDKPDNGAVHVARHVRIGYLPQEAGFRSDRTLREAMLAVFSELREQAARLRELESRLSGSGANPAAWDSAVLDEYTALLTHFEEQGGYTFEQRVDKVLTGLGFEPDLWNRPAAALSGGQRTRARLARMLLEEPDFLLLDEPTNHLDLETTEWLESFLSTWRGGIAVVSHDRYFLDKVTTRTVELINGKAESYPAPYSRYLYLRAERYRRHQKEYEAQRAQIARTEEFIRRYGAGQRSREAKGREKRLNRVERLDAAPKQSEGLRGLRLTAAARSGDIVLSTVRLRVGYPGRQLLALPNIQLARSQRVALIGPNGSGKSTLLKTLVGEIPPLGGSFAWGTNAEVGYYAQSHEGLRRNSTVLEEMLNASPMSEEAARAHLGRFLFSGDDVYKAVADLSGGERSRLALARLMTQQANMLLLDEPTNHLDIAARDALESVIRVYAGSIVFVSHDRYFIDAVATAVWAVERGEVRAYAGGGYSSYLEERARAPLAPIPAGDAPGAAGAVQPPRQRRAPPRRDEPPQPHAVQAVRDEGIAARVAAQAQREDDRRRKAAPLVRQQGQPLTALLALADDHAGAQDVIAAADAELVAAIRRTIG